MIRALLCHSNCQTPESLTIYFNQGEMSVPLSGDQQVILANGIEGTGLKKVLQAGGVALVEGV